MKVQGVPFVLERVSECMYMYMACTVCTGLGKLHIYITSTSLGLGGWVMTERPKVIKPRSGGYQTALQDIKHAVCLFDVKRLLTKKNYKGSHAELGI